MARSGLALTVAICLAVFEIGSCTRCYQCNSQIDRSCADPFTATALTPVVDCASSSVEDFNKRTLGGILPPQMQAILGATPGAPKYCHKFVMKTGTVVRTCLDVHPGDRNTICNVVDHNNVKFCNACEKDLCNGAGGISLSTPMALLALVASYLYYSQ